MVNAISRITSLLAVSAVALATLVAIPDRAEAVTPALSSLNPPANALPSDLVSSDEIETAPLAEGFTISSSHEDIGDTRYPSLEGTITSDLFGDNEYATVTVVDMATGEVVGHAYRTVGEEDFSVPIQKFAGNGAHYYQAFFGDFSDWHESYDDLTEIVAKTSILEWSRERPITISLSISDGSVFYELNQEINGEDYGVEAYDLDLNRRVSHWLMPYGFRKFEEINGPRFREPGRTSANIVALLRPYDGDEVDACGGVNCDGEGYDKFYERTYSAAAADAVAVSNVINFGRSAWSVSPMDQETAGWREGYFDFGITHGGGMYELYLVKDSTGEILNVGDPFFQLNPRYPDDSWTTLYVAWNYQFDDRLNNTEAQPAPTQLHQLQDIIASSKGLRDPAQKLTDADELKGGANPDMNCPVTCVGDPVNSLTGEFFERRVDMGFENSPSSLELKRSFSTKSRNEKSALGLGWSHGFEMKAVRPQDETRPLNELEKLQIETETGALTNFERQSDGSYRAPNSSITTELRFQNGELRYERKDGTVYSFLPTNGRLTSIAERGGNTISLTYASNGRLTKAADSFGNTITFSYTSAGLVSGAQSNSGQSVSYRYDSKSRLTSMTDAKGVQFTYTYDSENRITRFTNELGGQFRNVYDGDRVSKQTDPLGKITTFEYWQEDYWNQLSNSTTTITYPNGLKVEETYKWGRLEKQAFGENTDENWGDNRQTIRYSYDRFGNLVSKAITGGSTESNIYDGRGNRSKSIDGYGNITNYEYNGSDDLTVIIDPEGNRTEFSYDSSGNLTSTKDALGNITEMSYDALSNLVEKVDPRGTGLFSARNDYRTGYSYDSKSRLQNESGPLGSLNSYSYDGKGNISSLSDGRQNAIDMSYGALGLPTEIFDALDKRLATSYDAMGNVLSSTDPLGGVATFTYDTMGRLLTSTNALNQKTEFSYDAMGNLVKTKLPSGKIETVEYDQFDNPIRSVDGAGVETRREFDLSGNMTSSTDGLDRKTRYSYDGNGNLAILKDPEGNTIRYSYNSRNLLSKAKNQLGQESSFSYDELGRLSEEKLPDGSTTSYGYDAVGNQTSITDELGKTKEFDYDGLNRRVAYRDEEGRETSYSYDATSNLVAQERADGSTVGYSYDPRNLLTAVNYPDSADNISYGYDDLGRKTSEKRGAQAATAFTYDAVGQLLVQGGTNAGVTQSFDADGNLVTVGYPSGRTTEYTYDGGNRAASVSSTGSISSGFSYDAASQLTGVSYGNGTVSSLSHTGLGQLKGFELKGPSGAGILSRSYELNPLGEALNARTSVAGQQTRADDFSYDSRGRLTEQSSTQPTSSTRGFGYGAGSNLTEISNRSQTFSDSGRLLTSGSKSFSYDGIGNRIADSSGSSFDWSSSGLLEVAQVGSSSVSYDYSASGLISKRSEGSSDKSFVWDLGKEIPVLLSDGEFEYIYSADGRTPFAQVKLSTGAVKYLHGDLNGSIIGATDSSAQLVGTVNYDPYGATTDAPVSRFGYAGEWIDPATDLSYNRARWLDSSTGTFLSEDPLVQLTVSAYSYTDGNPLLQFDPLGLFTNPAKEFGNWLYESSDGIGLFLTVATVGLMVVGGGAVLIPAMAVVGASLAILSGLRDLQGGKLASAAESFLSAAPGVASIRSSLRVGSIRSSMISRGYGSPHLTRNAIKKATFEERRYGRFTDRMSTLSDVHGARKWISKTHDRLKYGDCAAWKK